MTTGRQQSDFDFEVGVAEAAPADWHEFLQTVPTADYSHTSHWHDSICGNRTGARQLWLTVRQDGRLIGGQGAVLAPSQRRLLGILPLQRLESSVEGTSGGPVLHSALPDPMQDQMFSRIVAAFLGRRPSGLASAAIALNPLSEARFGKLLRGQPGWERQDSPTAMVSLDGGLEVVERQRMVMNKRNERNRGLRRGAEVFATQDTELLAAYYPIYEKASAHWGVVPTPLGQLEDLLLDPHDHVFFTCVRHEKQVIGGHLCLHLGERVFAWNGVTDPAFARTHFPATLCFWGDIVEACNRSAQWLDFGASGGINSLSGFKKYFGAELMERGFYVNDSGPLRALRRISNLAGQAKAGTSGRWHDNATGKPRAGGQK